MSENKLFGKNARNKVLICVIILLIAVFSASSDNFFSIGTLMNFIRQNVVLFIASMGTLIIMLTGGLDLSVGSTGALAGMVAALVMTRVGMENTSTGWIGVAIVVLIGVIVGSINGYFIGYLNISPFMATLAMTSITRGATIAISNNSRIVVSNEFYVWLGNKTIPLNFGSIKANFPVSVVLVIAIVLLTYIILRKISFGRKLYAVGGNKTAAICSGINARKVILIAYIINSIFMGLGSIIWVGRTMSAVPRQGEGFEFNVLTAVILGGCSLAGGAGTLSGTLIGVTLLGIISTGLGMIALPPYVIYWVQGALIILAIYTDVRMGMHSKKVSVDHQSSHSVHVNRDKVIELIERNEQKVLELSGISKTFPGVKALDNMNLRIERGKVHAIVGENGAGKSTLMKILTGVYKKDSGEIKINGIPIEIRNPVEAQKFGISIIYQEFALVPYMSVAQNIFLGKELPAKFRLFLDRAGMRRESKNILKRVNLKLDVDSAVQDCRVGQQQMVEIAKALGANSWVVVMDEPTAALTEDDKDRLFKIIKELKAQGVAIVYISHRMAEIFSIADEVTVLRDGKHVISTSINEVDENKLIKYMVGREITDIFSREKAEQKDVVIEVKNLYRKGVFAPISFSVRSGEVLGFSGLMGAGRTEIMRCLFGLDKHDGGEIYVNGKKVNISSPKDAIRAGICLVSEDRRREGIIPQMSVRENITIPSLTRISKCGFVNTKEENVLALEYIDKLRIKTPSPDQKIGNLSGGNQQKVCLAKWLALNPNVIVLDEPTRGIDVGAKAEIHKLIEELAKAGMAVIIISSELPEILGVCDRIIVLYEGKKTGELMVDDSVTQEVIMERAAGTKEGA
jgi:ribose transport system ATP-binding protein